MSIYGKGKTVGVPRGLLRFLVLKMLSEKPMSGAEIVERIEMQTGSWKPSPGSIYPLLAWLSDKGFTKELPRSQDGFKRYSFTELGNKFLEKQLIQAKDFQKKMEFLAPLLMRGLPIGANQEKFKDLKDAAGQLIKQFMTFRHKMNQLSKEDSIELTKAIKTCSKKIQKIYIKMETI